MKYSASFTSGALLFDEIDALADILADPRKDELLKYEIAHNQHMRVNSEEARKRKVTEIKYRSEQIDKDFWEYYVSCTSEEEKRLLLFYLVMKAHSLVFDFHFDVTLHQWKSGNTEIDPYFYTMKLNEIEAENDEVARWSDTTKAKIISSYQTMLRQARLMLGKTLVVPIVNDSFWCYFVTKGDTWFLEACLMKQVKRQQIIKHCQ